MEKLSTIQKRGNPNEVYVNRNRDGTCNYIIVKTDCAKYDDAKKLMIVSPEDVIADIILQNKTLSITEEDLLEIVRDRLTILTSMCDREVHMALTHIEEALMWLSKKKEVAIERENTTRSV